jgi:hypothetical protein
MKVTGQDITAKSGRCGIHVSQMNVNDNFSMTYTAQDDLGMRGPHRSVMGKTDVEVDAGH